MSGDEERELWHSATELGDDAFGGGGADAGEGGEALGVLFFDHRGHFLDGADHGAQSFFDANAVDFAEHVEEFAFDRAQKPDEARDEAAPHRVAFEVFDGVEADLAAELVLQVAAREFRNEDFVLERADGECERIGSEGNGGAGDFGDHSVRGRGLGT